MLDMLFFVLAIYQYIIKENQYRFSEVWGENSIHQLLDVAGALHNPNGMTKYS
jgi:hypothetical protein